MDPALISQLAEQGATTLIAVGAFLYIIRQQQKMLEEIARNQTRHTALMYRLLKELGVVFEEAQL